jgi:glycosyltransferase involved in cell wall biosynthesis
VHRYDKNWLLPYYAVKGFPKFTTSMFGVPPEPPMTQLYDEVLPSPIPFPDLIRTLADSYAMVESYTLKSFGRLTIEAAVLGIPVVGSGCVASQHTLFPDLKCSSNDPIQWRARVERLINDREFYRDCATHAMSHSELYSYSSCRNSLLKLLNDPQA